MGEWENRQEEEKKHFSLLIFQKFWHWGRHLPIEPRFRAREISLIEASQLGNEAL